MPDFFARVEGVERLEQALTKLAGSLRPPRAERLLRDLAIILERRTADAFKRQTAPENVGYETSRAGQRWARLAPSTLKRRGVDAVILQDTGLLRQSISSQVRGLSAAVGTAVYYGKFHQKGTRKMPERPFLGWNEADIRRMNRLVEEYIERHVG